MKVTFVRFAALATALGTIAASKGIASEQENSDSSQQDLENSGEVDSCTTKEDNDKNADVADELCNEELSRLLDTTKQVLKFDPMQKKISRPICRS